MWLGRRRRGDCPILQHWHLELNAARLEIQSWKWIPCKDGCMPYWSSFHMTWALLFCCEHWCLPEARQGVAAAAASMVLVIMQVAGSCLMLPRVLYPKSLQQTGRGSCSIYSLQPAPPGSLLHLKIQLLAKTNKPNLFFIPRVTWNKGQSHWERRRERSRPCFALKC